MNRQEAMSHAVSSAKYWAGDTIDNLYYSNNLGLEKALEEAIKHVKNSHGYELNQNDIDELKEKLKISNRKNGDGNVVKAL